MNPRILAPTAVLIASMLTACGDTAPKASPAATSAAQAADDTAVDAEIERDIAQLGAGPTRLYAENAIFPAKIAPGGDFSISGKAVAIDDAQRALLVAYRERFVAIAQAGQELSARSTGAAADKIGDAIGGVFGDADPNDLSEELKSEGEKMTTAAGRICDTLPALHDAQNALTAALPEFKPYAHIVEADVAACHGAEIRSRSSAEKIGKLIGTALESSFSGGLVAGYMESEARHSAEKGEKNSAPAPKNEGGAQ